MQRLPDISLKSIKVLTVVMLAFGLFGLNPYGFENSPSTSLTHLENMSSRSTLSATLSYKPDKILQGEETSQDSDLYLFLMYFGEVNELDKQSEAETLNVVKSGSLNISPTFAFVSYVESLSRDVILSCLRTVVLLN